MGQDGNDPGQPAAAQGSGSDHWSFMGLHIAKKTLMGGVIGAAIGAAAFTAGAAAIAVAGAASIPFAPAVLATWGVVGGTATLSTIGSMLLPIAATGAMVGGGLGAAINGGIGAMGADDAYKEVKEREKVQAYNARMVEQRSQILEQTNAVKQAQLKRQSLALGVETNPNKALPNLADGQGAGIAN